MTDEPRFELPDGLSREEERAILLALERYLLQESPQPDPWVMAGRLDATGYGVLQARRHMAAAWLAPTRPGFVRPGIPALGGRGDAR
ncbi:MAG: hypothetical protein ACRDHS_14785 [Actinomycetota bacterium]